MKKRLKGLLLLLTVFVSAVAFVSCSKDSDDDSVSKNDGNDSEKLSNPIVGTWMFDMAGSKGGHDGMVEQIIYQFANDGKVVYHQINHRDDEEDDGMKPYSHYDTYGYGTYTFANDTLTLRMTETRDVWSIEGWYYHSYWVEGELVTDKEWTYDSGDTTIAREGEAEIYRVNFLDGNKKFYFDDGEQMIFELQK